MSDQRMSEIVRRLSEEYGREYVLKLTAFEMIVVYELMRVGIGDPVLADLPVVKETVYRVSDRMLGLMEAEEEKKT